MKIVLIYPKDVTRLIAIPSGMTKIADIQDYIEQSEDLEAGDQVIIKNKFYVFNGKWEQVSDEEAEYRQATGGEKGLGRHMEENQKIG